MTGNHVYRIAELAEYAELLLIGDENHLIYSMNNLQEASEHQLSFLSGVADHERYILTTQAGCVIISPEQQHLFSGNKLVSTNPYYSYAVLTALFNTVDASNNTGNIHSSAVIGSNTCIEDNVTIAPHVVIGNNVTIAQGSKIGAGCYIGDNAYIGENTMIYANVSVYHSTHVGKCAIVHSHAVIGSDGFGFVPKQDGWQKIYQLGRVLIGDDVEIGAGTVIDRGALSDTTIANGVKLDNHIHIAHNVRIGENTAIAAATAVAGSTVIGKRCTIAGHVAIVGHITIADNVHITADTLVTKSIPVAGSYSSGMPIRKTSIWKKNVARFNRLDKVFQKPHIEKP